MPRLIWVFAGRTLILLVLSCRGSYVLNILVGSTSPCFGESCIHVIYLFLISAPVYIFLKHRGGLKGQIWYANILYAYNNWHLRATVYIIFELPSYCWASVLIKCSRQQWSFTVWLAWQHFFFFFFFFFFSAAVLCPWARHFTPRKYWLITQEAMAPSRYDWKIVDWDVKPQHNQLFFQRY